MTLQIVLGIEIEAAVDDMDTADTGSVAALAELAGGGEFDIAVVAVAVAADIVVVDIGVAAVAEI